MISPQIEKTPEEKPRKVCEDIFFPFKNSYITPLHTHILFEFICLALARMSNSVQICILACGLRL